MVHKGGRKKRFKKLAPITLLAGAALVGAVLVQKGSFFQTSGRSPKIESVSPSPIVVGKEFTVTGSGFTTEEEYEVFKGKGSVVAEPRRDVLTSYPGNWYQLRGRLHGRPVFSPDGKTLTFELSLSSKEVPENCLTETTGKKCQIPIQIVNAAGVASNVKLIEVFIPEIKPLIFSSAYALDNPTSLNVPAGATDVDVAKV